MSQSIFTSLNPYVESGIDLATILLNFKDAIVSGMSGTSRPSALQAGGCWVDTTNDPTSWTLKIYTGSIDIQLFTIDLGTGSASISATSSLFQITKSSNDSVGAVLKLFKKRPSGNQTKSGDIIGEVDFVGNDDADTQRLQARIRSLSQNDVTSSAYGSKILFEGVTLGASTLSEWMRLIDGKMGIGTQSPEETLHVTGTGIKAEHASDDTVGVKTILRKKRVTGVGQVQSGDTIAKQSFTSTNDTGAEVEVANIEVLATENHTTLANGSKVIFRTKNIGSTTFVDQITVDGTSVDIPNLKIGTLTNTELSYVHGVTSAIQTQLNSKATPADITTAINALIASAPTALDTLNELATALGNDANFASTVATGLGNRLRVDTAAQGLTGTQKTNAKTNINLDNVPNVDATVASNITQDSTHRFTTDAQQTAWTAKQSALTAGTDYLAPTGNGSGLTGLTKTQVGLSNVPNLDTSNPANITQDATHRFATDTEKATWNAKQSALVAGTDYTTPTGVENLTNKSIQNPSRLDPKKDTKANLTTYATTAQNGELVWASDTKEFFTVKDGALSAVGGGGSGVGSVDILSTDQADSSTLTDYTQTGLELVTAPVLHGTKSFRLQHSTSIKSFKKVIAVDKKFRGKNLTLNLDVVSSATSGNLNILISDETNATTLAASQSIATNSQALTATTANTSTSLTGMTTSAFNTLKVGMVITGSAIPVGTTITALNTSTLTATLSQAATGVSTGIRISDLVNRKSFSFDVPANCLSMSYTIPSVVEANTESYLDDIVVQLTATALTSTSITIPVINDFDWTSFTPSSPNGSFGTMSGLDCYYKRKGSDLYVKFKGTSGTTLAAEAQISLPAGLTSTAFSTIRYAGILVRANSAAVSNYVLIEPSKSYFTFSMQGTSNASLTKANAGSMIANTEAFSFETGPIPVQGWSENNSTTTTIPLTSAQLVQTPDSYMALNGWTGYGSTNTGVARLTNLASNTGSDIKYVSDSVFGDSWTALTAGTYTLNYSQLADTSTGTNVAFTLNSASLTIAGFSSIPSASILDIAGSNSISSTRLPQKLSWTGYLNVNDIIRIQTDAATTPYVVAPVHFSISKQGSLKQLNVSSDSKITIPTHQLRFEGASARGSTDTFIVKFDTQAITQGDAWTIIGTPSVNGTVVQMNKAGKLSVQANLLGVAGMFTYISKNQSILTTTPTTSELQCRGSVYALNYPSIMSCTFDVNIGDKIRIGADVAPTANALNILSLSLTETSIPANFSNVLPQWSQSDSCVQLRTANGYGSTNTKIRRFSNMVQNLGSDVIYTDDAALGGYFKINVDGNFNISYTDCFVGGNMLGITKNSSEGTISPQSLTVPSSLLAAFAISAANLPGEVSWSGQLNAGDIIRAHTEGTATGSNGTVEAKFTISKVGKPNLTSVDVTPFVNMKITDTQSSFLSSSTAFGTAIISGALTQNSNTGIYKYDSTTGIYTALKNANVNVSASLGGVSVAFAQVYKNSTVMAQGWSVATNSYIASASASFEVVAGDTFYAKNGNSTTTSNLVTILATADNNATASPTQQVSSDTMSFVFKTTAITTSDAIGTFNTYLKNASNNFATVLNTVAPTQTTSSMNTNGILVTGVGYTSASTTALPTRFDIMIGTGLQSRQVDAFFGTGKISPSSYDYRQGNSGSAYTGCIHKYSPTTGILTIEVEVPYASITGIDSTVLGNGYFTFTASKSPSLVSLPNLMVRTASITGQFTSGASGQASVAGTYVSRYINTLKDATGIVLNPSAFTGTGGTNTDFQLGAGTYKIIARAAGYNGSATVIVKHKIRNTTDGIDVVTGEAVRITPGIGCADSFADEFTITGTKTFQMMSIMGSASGVFGVAYGDGSNETYANIQVIKIK